MMFGEPKGNLLAHSHSRERDLLLLGVTIQGQFGKEAVDVKPAVNV